MSSHPHFINLSAGSALGFGLGAIASGAARLALALKPSFKPVTLLNVSYDPTRERYAEFNAAFARHWKATTGQDVIFEQSHGGSGTSPVHH